MRVDLTSLTGFILVLTCAAALCIIVGGGVIAKNRGEVTAGSAWWMGIGTVLMLFLLMLITCFII